MLWFEQQVVTTLVSPDASAARRSQIEDYVDGALRSMPEYLRAGVASESLIFGAWPRLEALLGRHDDTALRARVERWKASRFDLVRQYVRMLQSLVLFAENELTTDAA
ncbi:MAG TPA: hypothetical protein VG869_08845 [Acidimicrobiia bacterium]|jgi:hypothetical protein|nr:hypothetical protein [Acidimicrobiia bacterium]